MLCYLYLVYDGGDKDDVDDNDDNLLIYVRVLFDGFIIFSLKLKVNFIFILINILIIRLFCDKKL